MANVFSSRAHTFLGNAKKMGKKPNWFNAVKKALSPDSKEKREQVCTFNRKSKKKWGYGKTKPPEPSSSLETVAPPPVPAEVKLNEAEQEQNKHAYSVAIATAAAEAAVAAAQAAAEVVRLTTVTRYSGKSREEKLSLVNGVLFTGEWAKTGLYYETVQKIFKVSKQGWVDGRMSSSHSGTFLLHGSNKPGNTTNRVGVNHLAGLNTFGISFIPGDVFVFPIGLIQFQAMLGMTDTVVLAGLSSQNPRVMTIANVVYG
ncbi:hypothetical protein ACLOJK_018328 [Asimina triloba]